MSNAQLRQRESSLREYPSQFGLAMHRLAVPIRLNRQGLDAHVSPKMQWLLHRYFVPRRDWTRQQLIAHGKIPSARRHPSLPPHAGRAWADFKFMLSKRQMVTVGYSKERPQRNRVKASPTRVSSRSTAWCKDGKLLLLAAQDPRRLEMSQVAEPLMPDSLLAKIRSSVRRPMALTGGLVST